MASTEIYVISESDEWLFSVALINNFKQLIQAVKRGTNNGDKNTGCLTQHPRGPYKWLQV